jgi:hypothetical protein
MSRTGSTAPRIAAAAALLCLAAAACGPARESLEYPYVADRPRVLFATAGGLSAKRPAPRADDSSRAEERRSTSYNASVLTADGRSILAVVNGAGWARIEAAAPEVAASKTGRRARRGGSKDGLAYRVVNSPFAPDFAPLSSAGAWPVEDGFIVQMYRDPFAAFVEGKSMEQKYAPARPAPGVHGDSARRILEIDSSSAVRVVDLPGLPDGFELFALFPSRGRWLGELRRDTNDAVELSFFETDAPIGSSPARAVSREVFESALAPKSLLSLQGLEGAALRSALAALGEGPWMLRYRSASGDDAWYLSEDRPEDAKRLWAWSLGSGRVLVLTTSGTLIDAGTGGTRRTELGSPLSGAEHTALAAASGLVAAAWEVGSFPAVDEAGLVIAPLER